MASLSFRLNPPFPNQDTQNNQYETVNQSATSTMASSTAHRDQEPVIPDLFTSPPPILDSFSTDTSDTQNETVDSCLPFLSAEVEILHYNQYGVPHLARERHIKFLRKHLERLPGRYVALDASRPWMLYWSLNGLAILGEDVSCYRDALVDTARSMQNTNGGFGGGIGHESHLACTYSMILALSVVGGEAVYEVIDRRALWKWLCALKRPDGGFQMAVGGEVDIR